jgi:hypothetical protein
LQFAYGPVGGGPEDAVVAARVKAQLIQAHLQGCDVIAAQHVTGSVLQEPLAYTPTGLFQAPEGLGTHDTVYGQPAVLLKLPHGRSDGLVISVAVRQGQ